MDDYNFVRTRSFQSLKPRPESSQSNKSNKRVSSVKLKDKNKNTFFYGIDSRNKVVQIKSYFI